MAPQKSRQPTAEAADRKAVTKAREILAGWVREDELVTMEIEALQLSIRGHISLVDADDPEPMEFWFRSFGGDIRKLIVLVPSIVINTKGPASPTIEFGANPDKRFKLRMRRRMKKNSDQIPETTPADSLKVVMEQLRIWCKLRTSVAVTYEFEPPFALFTRICTIEEINPSDETLPSAFGFIGDDSKPIFIIGPGFCGSACLEQIEQFTTARLVSRSGQFAIGITEAGPDSTLHSQLTAMASKLIH